MRLKVKTLLNKNSGESPKKKGAVNSYPPQPLKDKEVSEPKDTGAVKEIFSLPSDLGVFLQRDVLSRIKERSRELKRWYDCLPQFSETQIRNFKEKTKWLRKPFFFFRRRGR